MVPAAINPTASEQIRSMGVRFMTLMKSKARASEWGPRHHRRATGPDAGRVYHSYIRPE